ncbi:MAG: aminotransferase class V-fold PLP-dependent enzyme, partial [Methanospirillum sp.]|nr:aminotransferase class V-fold PLP-dependent enzyme [Methanospirillum sp.]
MPDSGTDNIYLNNAATSWPKPPEVLTAVQNSLSWPFTGGGRSIHTEFRDDIRAARVAVADLFGFHESEEQVIFSHNATDALNTLIFGFISAHPGPVHVISSVLEHNSVLRPLHELEKAGKVNLTLIPVHGAYLDLEQLAESIKHETRLAVLNHGSNVMGSVQNLDEIFRILHE